MKTTHLFKLPLLVLLPLLWASSTALASPPDKPPSFAGYVGIFGGGHLVLDDWDLNQVSDQRGLAPSHSALAGLRVGAQFTSWLGLELSVGVLPLSYNDEAKSSGLALLAGGDLLINPYPMTWSPYIALGGGAYALMTGDYANDEDWEIHYGLGVRGFVTEALAIRIDAKHHFTDTTGWNLANNISLAAGLDYFFGGSSDDDFAVDRTDSDGDGIPDVIDACPNEPGPPETSGCPDRDLDGVPDKDDLCPDEPAPFGAFGCPDRDQDGVPDKDDLCPDEVGLKEYDGCPPPAPDSDGDGVPDDEDFCPDEPGPASTQGCPDRDGDGVIDELDKCPDIPGVPEEDGCLPSAVQQRFSGNVRGISFASGSATILKSSFTVLNQAAKLFQQYPSLKVEISGHTDNVGVKEHNQKLSQERADAVKAYLIRKGIDESRLISIGYGQDKPVASNNTGAGRAQNRRIEFRIIGQYGQ